MLLFYLSSLLLLTAAVSVAQTTITTCNAYADCVANSTTSTSDPSGTVLYIPSGAYALQTAVRLDHASFFTLQIDGELDLVFNPSLAGYMFQFSHSDYVVWRGNGTINGHGGLWRPGGDLNLYPNRPRIVGFLECNHVDVSEVTLLNAPLFHVVIRGNNNVVHDMKIVTDHIGATDGIDVSGNNYVHDVSIENGDECVTVKSPTNGFRAENIQCLYSGGCNIGSFGTGGSVPASVQNVYYRNATQSRGDAGTMLKSYPSATGLVQNVTYEDFTFAGVSHPIQIDDFWCPHTECPKTTGNLTWKDITFKKITGTGDASSRPTIYIDCISGYECTDIVFEDVHLTKLGHFKARVRLSNACGTGLSTLPACT